MWLTRLWSDNWGCQLDREWVAAICSALVREDTPPARAIFVYVMGRKSKCDPLARGCMSVLLVLLASGRNPFQCTPGNGRTVQCTPGNRFQCTPGNGQTVQCTPGNRFQCTPGNGQTVQCTPGNRFLFPRGIRNMLLGPSRPPVSFPRGTAQGCCRNARRWWGGRQLQRVRCRIDGHVCCCRGGLDVRLRRCIS